MKRIRGLGAVGLACVVSVAASSPVMQGVARTGATVDRDASPAAAQNLVEADVESPTGLPDPPCFDNTTRFVDCGNGTVTDTVTGLIWQLDANCAGMQVGYEAANDAAAALADGQCGLTDGSRPGDWRLATKEEWEAMLDPSCPTPKIVGNGPSGGCYVDNPWASGVQSTFYWSSTTYAIDTTIAWQANLPVGIPAVSFKTNRSIAWAVR